MARSKALELDLDGAAPAIRDRVMIFRLLVVLGGRVRALMDDHYAPLGVTTQQAAVLTYLREREQVTDVYVEAMKPVSLLDGSGRELEALCYIVDRGHPQYAGRLSLERQAELVRSASGLSGNNSDYVLNTVRHLEEVGIHDVELMALAQRLTEASP